MTNLINLYEEVLNEGDSLAKKYVDYTDDPANRGKNWDDFYDFAGVPKAERTDFGSAAILKQARELIKNEQ